MTAESAPERLKADRIVDELRAMTTEELWAFGKVECEYSQPVRIVTTTIVRLLLEHREDDIPGAVALLEQALADQTN